MGIADITAVDRNNPTPDAYKGMLPSGTKTETGTTTANTNQTQRTSGSQTSAGSSSTQNMTPEALSALQALILQLSDHPAVSSALAEQALAARGMKAPSMVPGNAGGTVTGIDPLTQMGGTYRTGESSATYLDEFGKPIRTAQEYAAAQARYEAAKQGEIAAGGMVKGGTAETQRQSEERALEIKRNREQQAKYSKEAAFNDASTLTSGYARKLAETIMPTILRAQEASGASGSATAALLANDAAARTAEAAAQTGINAAVNYGQITDTLANTLEALTRNNTPALDALVQALNVAKGAVQNTTKVEGQTTSQTQQTSGTTTTTKADNAVQQGSQPQVGAAVQPTYSLPTTVVAQPAAASGPSSMKITKTTPAEADPWAGYTFEQQIDMGVL